MRSIITTKRAAVGLAALSLAAGVTAASANDGGSPNGHARATKGATALDQAALPPGTDLQFHTLAPCRLVDTRLAGGTLNDSARVFTAVGALGGQGGNVSGCGVPTSAVAIQANVTAVSQGESGFLTVYATGLPTPTASTVNFGKSGAAANAVPVALSAGDQFTVFSHNKSHVVTDVIGYYTKPLYAAVTSSGGIYQGISSGVVSAVRTGTGAYTVTFNRAVRACSVTASDIIFAKTNDVSVDQTFPPNNDAVAVRVTDASGNPSDTYFNITATC